jgi:hypothetical protein
MGFIKHCVMGEMMCLVQFFFKVRTPSFKKPYLSHFVIKSSNLKGLLERPKKLYTSSLDSKPNGTPFSSQFYFENLCVQSLACLHTYLQ